MPVLLPAFFAYTIRATPMAPATMEELARMQVGPVAGEHRERPRAVMSSVASTEKAIVATTVIAPLAATPPAVARGFQAVTDPLPAATQGFDPPDAAGAAGPQHVVGAFNNAITVHDRAGNLLSRISAAQFWHIDGFADKFLYDPRVAYDAASDRWVLIMLGDDPNTETNGVLFVGLSTSGNPAAGWRRYRLSVDPSGQLDADVSHLAVTADRIAVSVRVFDQFSQVNTTVFSALKTPAFAGDLSFTATPLSPATDRVPLSSDDTTLRIALYEGDSHLQISELLPSGQLTNTKEYVAFSAIRDPTVPCAQRDTTFTLDCTGVPLTGLTRNGTTWVVTDSGRTVALIWKVTSAGATQYVVQDNAKAIAYPSIAVNRRGAALVGYVVAASSIYLSAGYSYIDPAGNISAMATLKSGEAPFRRERWGDFTTTRVDPADDLSFWTLGIYANTPAGSYDRWAAWWGYVPIADGPVHHRAVRH